MLEGIGIFTVESVWVRWTLTKAVWPQSDSQQGILAIEGVPDLSRLQQFDAEWLDPSRQSQSPAHTFPVSVRTNNKAAKRFSIPSKIWTSS